MRGAAQADYGVQKGVCLRLDGHGEMGIERWAGRAVRPTTATHGSPSQPKPCQTVVARRAHMWGSVLGGASAAISLARTSWIPYVVFVAGPFARP